MQEETNTVNNLIGRLSPVQTRTRVFTVFNFRGENYELHIESTLVPSTQKTRRNRFDEAERVELVPVFKSVDKCPFWV